MRKLNRRCDGVTRRSFVRLGALSAFGLTMWDAENLQAKERAARSAGDRLRTEQNGPGDTAFGRAKHCILVWLDGGPSHLDTFDPKPEAAAEIRGPFGSIATALAGVRVSECLPRMAGMLDRVTLIRSLTSPLGEHNLATQYMLTGHQPTPALDYPVLGSMVSYAKDSGPLPPFISIPHHRVGGVDFPAAGYLSANHRPFETGGDPKRPDFAVAGLTIRRELDEDRLRRRSDFVQRLNQWQREAVGLADSKPQIWGRAVEMLTDPNLQRAFDLHGEPHQLREQYGMTTVGQSCLLAKRLVTSGVSFVTVNFPGWDTHDAAVVRLRDGFSGATTPVGLIPQLDQALSALLMDLERTGLLADTLVVVMGEFGRTPKINAIGGRDHWPRAFSAIVAGGGVPAGTVIGRTDRHGQIPVDDPVTPADLAASVYWLLGIDPKRIVTTRDGRPVPILNHGRVIKGVIG
mgnify:CR=1 FL=1